MIIKDLFIRYWKNILIIILIILLFQECKEKPNVKIKTVTKETIKTVYDTVKEVRISKPKKVYITIRDTIYKDSIVYTKDSIKVNRYPLKLFSNKATFEGFAFTSGKLYDFTGKITYPEKIIETTTEKIIRQNKGGLFLYGQSNLDFDNFGVGLDWQIKNKMIIGSSVTYSQLNKNYNLNLKLGFKIK